MPTEAHSKLHECQPPWPDKRWPKTFHVWRWIKDDIVAGVCITTYKCDKCTYQQERWS